jgi:hypothetical protein
VGFNSTRRYRDDKMRDIVLLGSAIAVVLALILWAVGIVG